MARFRFGLEQVRRHRRLAVDRQSRLVARAERQLAALARRLAALESDIEKQVVEASRGRGRMLRAPDLRRSEQWLGHLRRRREELAAELELAARDLAAARRRLTEAWRDLEVLTRLRERQFAAWTREQDRRERKILDEIGHRRAPRHGPDGVAGPGAKGTRHGSGP